MSRAGFAHLKYSSYESLKYAYDNNYPTAPHLESKYDNNESDKYSFDMIHWLYFYVDMYAMSEDTNWVQLACDSIDKMLSNTDDLREGRGEITIDPLNPPIDADTDYAPNAYYLAPYPYALNGDSAPSFGSYNTVPSFNETQQNLAIQILIDGQVIGAIASVADLILDNPVDLSAFATKANDYFSQVNATLSAHDNSWRYDKVSSTPAISVSGIYYFPNRKTGADSVFSNILPFNHNAGALQAGILYHKHFTNAEFLNKAEAFIEFTRDDSQPPMLCRKTSGDAWVWPYSMEDITSDGEYTRVEDLNHGSYTFQFFKTAYDNSYLSFTSDELTKYTKAALNAWLDDGVIGSVAEKFDGSGEMPGGEVFDPAHFAWLCQFDQDLFKMMRDLTATNFIANYSNLYRAYSSLLRYKPNGLIF